MQAELEERNRELSNQNTKLQKLLKKDKSDRFIEKESIRRKSIAFVKSKLVLSHI
jgi:hypothetical protein